MLEEHNRGVLQIWSSQSSGPASECEVMLRSTIVVLASIVVPVITGYEAYLVWVRYKNSFNFFALFR